MSLRFHLLNNVAKSIDFITEQKQSIWLLENQISLNAFLKDIF